jgi:hypothetical protein
MRLISHVVDHLSALVQNLEAHFAWARASYGNLSRASLFGGLDRRKQIFQPIGSDWCIFHEGQDDNRVAHARSMGASPTDFQHPSRPLFFKLTYYHATIPRNFDGAAMTKVLSAWA